MANTIQRFQVADYIAEKSETPNFKFMGVGFTQLDENPNAQTEETVYICDKASTTFIKNYKPQFPFESTLIKDQEAVMMLYKVGEQELTGADAEFIYVRVNLFEPVPSLENTYKARKFIVSCECSSFAGKGGENIVCSGNLNGVGNFIEGTFNTATKVFTEAESGS